MNRFRFLYVIIGIITAIIIAEASMRILGFFRNASSEFQLIQLDKSDDTFLIACLGDSFTEGTGAPRGFDYPSQLKELINSKTDNKIEVINLGRGGNNSAQVIYELKKVINQKSPEIAVILCGINNLWNWWGYESYVGDIGIFAKLRNLIRKLRLYGFFNLAVKELKNIFVKDLDAAISIPDITNETDGLKSNDSKSLIEKIKRGNATWKDFLRVGLIYYEKEQYNEAEKHILSAKNLKPDIPELYKALSIIYEREGKLEKLISELIKLQEFYPEDASYSYKIGQTFFNLQDFKKSKNWYKKALKIDPSLSHFYKDIAQLYIGAKEIEVAKNIFKRLSKTNKTAKDYYIMFKSNYNQDKIINWIIHDINKIISICRSNNVVPVILNYPHPDMPHFVLTPIRDAAKKSNVIFIDSQKKFIKKKNEGEDIEKYFIKDKHCNSKGYHLIARFITDKILNIIDR